MCSSFESLEARQMMSAAMKAGVLAITGTKNDDVIVLNLAGNQIKVSLNGKTSSFKASGIKRIDVNALDGNDQLSTSAAIATSMQMDGGRGNDRLDGGSGNDTIYGDDERRQRRRLPRQPRRRGIRHAQRRRRLRHLLGRQGRQ